jgi:hypothetical protein
VNSAQVARRSISSPVMVKSKDGRVNDLTLR